MLSTRNRCSKKGGDDIEGFDDDCCRLAHAATTRAAQRGLNPAYLADTTAPTFDVDPRELARAIAEVVREQRREIVERTLNQLRGRVD